MTPNFDELERLAKSKKHDLSIVPMTKQTAQALIARVREAEKDRERLDWLESQGQLYNWGFSRSGKAVFLCRNTSNDAHKTARQAIDAAISAKGAA